LPSHHRANPPPLSLALTKLSQPEDTRRLTMGCCDNPPATRLPGGGAGAQHTPVHPMECAPGIFAASHDPSPLCEMTDTVPSEDAHAAT
jgi:hypothetical protein